MNKAEVLKGLSDEQLKAIKVVLLSMIFRR